MARILILDDAIITRKTLRSILEREGHEVLDESCSSADIKKLYTELRPDILTIDFSMAKRTCTNLIKEIRELNQQQMILMAIDSEQQIDFDDVVESGVRSFLLKPYREANINAAINKMRPLSYSLS